MFWHLGKGRIVHCLSGISRQSTNTGTSSRRLERDSRIKLVMLMIPNVADEKAQPLLSHLQQVLFHSR